MEELKEIKELIASGIELIGNVTDKRVKIKALEFARGFVLLKEDTVSVNTSLNDAERIYNFIQKED